LKFLPGDFFKDSLPGSYVLIVGHGLNDWHREEKLLLSTMRAVRMSTGC
jgi:hypothetical protein